MPSPSSIDSLLHLDLDPLMRRLVALIKVNDSLAHIQCNVLYFWSHLVASLSANRLKRNNSNNNNNIQFTVYCSVNLFTLYCKPDCMYIDCGLA